MGYMKELLIRIHNGGDDAVEAAKKLQPQWISVSERQPQLGDRIIGWHSMKENKTTTTWMTAGGVRSMEDERLSNLTHWMPIPEPPADAE